MAVAVQMDFPGGTLDQYDQVVEKMGFQKRGTGGPGGLFHWVRKTDEGIRVIDVWASAEAFQSFAQEKIVPITREVGVAGEPRIQMFEVHNYLTAG